MRELLESDPHLANQTALSSQTGEKVQPLFIAAQQGHIDVVKYLTAVFIETLQTQPEADRATAIRAMVTAPRKSGATPIFIAAENGHIDAVKYLIAVFIETLQTLSEADRDSAIRAMLTATGTDGGATPVYIAAQNGHIDVLKHLIAAFIETLQTLPEADRANAILTMVTTVPKSGATPIFIAAENGHIEAVKHLTAVFNEILQTQPEADRDTAIRAVLMAPETDHGATPVYIAAQNGHIDVLKHLIAALSRLCKHCRRQTEIPQSGPC